MIPRVARASIEKPNIRKSELFSIYRLPRSEPNPTELRRVALLPELHIPDQYQCSDASACQRVDRRSKTARLPSFADPIGQSKPNDLRLRLASCRKHWIYAAHLSESKSRLTGLFNSRTLQLTDGVFVSVSSSISIRSSTETLWPRWATSPFTFTRLASIHFSASRREASPLSAIVFCSLLDF